MLKVIMADDEPHFRSYMENVLEWETLGLEVRGIYKNGEEVLQRIPDINPDIALLDINMPGLSGISLTERLKEMYPEITIVFVTGYSEFEYARKAVRLGVDEYLLKPFSKEELTGVLERIKLKLEHRNEEKQQKKIEQKIVKEELLKRWLHDNYGRGESEFIKNLRGVNIEFTSEILLVSVIEMDYIMNIRRKGEDVGLWKFAVTNITEEILHEEGIATVLFEDYEDRIISIVNCSKTDEIEQKVKYIYEEILSKVNMYLGFTISVGMGSPEEGVKGMRESFRNAMRALEEKFILGGNRVTVFRNIEKKDKVNYFYRLDLNDKLLHALRKNEWSEIKEIIDVTKNKIFEHQLPADHAYMIISGMLSICLSYITEMDGKINDMFGEDFALYSALSGMASLDESFAFLESVFTKVMDTYQITYSKRRAEILSQVETYINENYNDTELSVEMIAAGVYLDSSYIRRIVSRQAGCTLSDLITRVRMKEAARLIRETDETIDKISEIVGYKEVGYFRKCFKRHFGVTPKQYDNQLRKAGH